MSHMMESKIVYSIQTHRKGVEKTHGWVGHASFTNKNEAVSFFDGYDPLNPNWDCIRLVETEMNITELRSRIL